MKVLMLPICSWLYVNHEMHTISLCYKIVHVCVLVGLCFRQLLLDEDIPCSHCINTVHFFPHGDQRGKEQQL